jgi:hypothetical protein
VPLSVGVRPPERPVLWFSTEEYFELTAIMSPVEEGVLRALSIEEALQRGCGLVRFGVPRDLLIRWPSLGRKAKMSVELANGLEKVARQVGSDPTRWHGSLAAIAIEGTCVEVMDEAQVWKRVREAGPLRKGRPPIRERLPRGGDMRTFEAKRIGER